MKTRFATLLGLAVAATLAAGPLAAATVKGVVEDADGKKVENATVWLIPAADVATMAKTPVEIKRDSPNDEPLEDNLAAHRTSYLQSKSGPGGKFTLPKVPKGNFFLYVEPADARYERDLRCGPWRALLRVGGDNSQSHGRDVREPSHADVGRMLQRALSVCGFGGASSISCYR